MRNKLTKAYPLIPLRDVVLFPHMIMPLFVARSKSVLAIEKMGPKINEIVFVTQRDSAVDAPQADDLYRMGVVAKISQTLKLPDGTLKILVQAQDRVKIVDIIEAPQKYFVAITEKPELTEEKGVEIDALVKLLLDEFHEYSKFNPKISNETLETAAKVKDISALISLIASNAGIEIKKKQEILELDSIAAKLKNLLTYIGYEVELMRAGQKIREDVKKQLDKTQREYFLNEQLKAINKELGDPHDGKKDIEEFEKKINSLALSQEAKEKANMELSRFKRMSPGSTEASVVRNYLEHLLSLPWGQETKSDLDLRKAENILNEEHYALDKVKDRILEFLAVQKRTKSTKGQILCFVGPPGVGKTSLAKAIAKAMGRDFVKFSLGGVRDEAEIRGHRKTYIGAMPGKILYLLKKAKSLNPVMLLDEIDKVGSDYRGDPTSALLEVLDPGQNGAFVDHYLEVEFDLSKIVFVATANTTDMHPALLDRMEIIRIAGYTEDEKQEIATKHLLEKQYTEHGLTKKDLTVSNDAIKDIIRNYTYEAGVRGLERELSKLARKAVREIEQKNKKKITIKSSNLADYLGVKKHRYGESEKKDLVGVSTGLAYTDFGGDLLSIEALLVPGDGKIKTTGKLGDVMEESAQAAFSFFWSRAELYGIEQKKFKNKDLHLHVPEGAVPKDGPSAGIAMFTAMVSVIANIPVKKNVAMTGEITLSGRVLPIGGLKEKLLAAHRGGIKTVLIPFENEKDLVEIPKNVTQDLEIILVKTADEAIRHALTKALFQEKLVKTDMVGQVSEENYNKCIITH